MKIKGSICLKIILLLDKLSSQIMRGPAVLTCSRDAVLLLSFLISTVWIPCDFSLW